MPASCQVLPARLVPGIDTGRPWRGGATFQGAKGVTEHYSTRAGRARKRGPRGPRGCTLREAGGGARAALITARKAVRAARAKRPSGQVKLPGGLP